MSDGESDYDINRQREIQEPFVGQRNMKEVNLSDQVTDWLLRVSFLVCIARIVSLAIQAAVNKDCSPMFVYNLCNMVSYVPFAVLFGFTSRKLRQRIMQKQKVDYKTNVKIQLICYGVFLVAKFAIVSIHISAPSVMGKCYLKHGLWRWTAGIGFLEISFFAYLVYRIFSSWEFWKKYN